MNRRFRPGAVFCWMFFHLLSLVAVVAEDSFGGKHLFILSGQSNMTGGVEKGFRQVVEVKLGTDRVAVARSMKSGRGIRFWVKDYELPADHEFYGKLKAGNGEEYPKLLEAVKSAGEAREFETVTFVWMQGESDAGRDLGVAYAKSFETLIGSLKSDLGLERMRFVIGRISDYGLHGDRAVGWKRMREVQVRLAEADPLGAWINTDDLNDIDGKPEGGLHYPADSRVILGKRFAEVAVGLLGAE